MPELRLSRRRLHQKAGILREWRQGARARGDEIPRDARFLRAAQRRRPDGAIRLLAGNAGPADRARSEEHTSELQSLMRISYAVFCLKKQTKKTQTHEQT